MPSVRLELLSDVHVEELERLAADPEVQRNTYVPEPPPSGFGCTWLEAYEKAGVTRMIVALVPTGDDLWGEIRHFLETADFVGAAA